jgi:NADH:ubiquinone oxidoreductase subunit 5 (subunit L)/multisubunit Na+/H+ antiporter MnhA subunit
MQALMVTTLGGLAMLVGIVILGHAAPSCCPNWWPRRP